MNEILERRKREALQARKERAKNMPQCAAWVKAMREVFPDLRVIWAEENGQRWEA